jgi:hypothetical protein
MPGSHQLSAASVQHNTGVLLLIAKGFLPFAILFGLSAQRGGQLLTSPLDYRTPVVGWL